MLLSCFSSSDENPAGFAVELATARVNDMTWRAFHLAKVMYVLSQSKSRG